MITRIFIYFFSPDAISDINTMVRTKKPALLSSAHVTLKIRKMILWGTYGKFW
jgi:hypothetical protein